MAILEKNDRLIRFHAAIVEQGYRAGHYIYPERVEVKNLGPRSGIAAKVTVDAATGRLVSERINRRSSLHDSKIVADVVATINLRERTFEGLCASGDTRALLIQGRFPHATIGVLPGDVFAVCMVPSAKWTGMVVCVTREGHPIVVRYALLRKDKVTARVYERRAKYRSATEVLATFKAEHAPSYRLLMSTMMDEVPYEA